MDKPIQDDGFFYCWGEKLSHNKLSSLTRRSYRCGCNCLTADGGYVKWESQCDKHQGATIPPAHIWINRF